MLASKETVQEEKDRIFGIEEMVDFIQTEAALCLPREIEVNVPPSVFLIPDNLIHLVIGSSKGWISVYQLDSGEFLSEVDKTNKPITSMSYSSGTLVAGDSTGMVFVLTFPELQCLKTIQLSGSNPIINCLNSDTFFAIYQSTQASLFRTDSEEVESKNLPAPASCADVRGHSLIVGYQTGLIEIYHSSSLGFESTLQLSLIHI